MCDRQPIIAFDLDDTLCYRTTEQGGIAKYRTSQPIQSMIDVCNRCYDEGYEVLIYTARGMYFCGGDLNKIIDELYELTKAQLDEWGIKHHRLVMGKIHFDLLIDDKVMNINDVDDFDDVKRRLEWHARQSIAREQQSAYQGI